MPRPPVSQATTPPHPAKDQLTRKEVARVLRHSPAIELRHPDRWESIIGTHSAEFGAYLSHFAERWATLMQIDITNTDTSAIPVVAEQYSRYADWDKITPYMFKRAVYLLRETWEYGEELRRWYEEEYS